MPGPLLTSMSTVMCPHGGRATPMTPSPRVSATAQPVVPITCVWTVVGCTFPAMTNGAQPPCVTVQFSTPSARASANGPLLLSTSTGTCMPNGVPAIVIPSQTRVNGQ